MNYDDKIKDTEVALESGDEERIKKALETLFAAEMPKEIKGEQIMNTVLTMMRAKTSINNKLAASINEMVDAMEISDKIKDRLNHELDLEDTRKKIAAE